MTDQASDRSRGFEAVVHGHVQGVGFRYFVISCASGLGVTGWVANRADGNVQVVAEGEPASLEALLAALREGPPGAEVTTVDVTDRPAVLGMTRFEVRSGYHPGD